MKRYRWNKRVFIRNLMVLMLILLMLWMVISYGEILIKNTNLKGGAVYSQWNLWMLPYKLQ